MHKAPCLGGGGGVDYNVALCIAHNDIIISAGGQTVSTLSRHTSDSGSQSHAK